MKAIVCKEFAAVDDLSWEEVPDPIAGENEVCLLYTSPSPRDRG